MSARLDCGVVTIVTRITNSFESGRTARQDQQVSTQAQTASSSSSSSSSGWIIILYILWSVETPKEWRSRRSRLYNIGLHFSRLVLVDSCGKVFPIVVAGSVRSEFFPAESKNIIFVRQRTLVLYSGWPLIRGTSSEKTGKELHAVSVWIGQEKQTNKYICFVEPGILRLEFSMNYRLLFELERAAATGNSGLN